MNSKIQTIQSLLESMDFRPELIQAGISALSGTVSPMRPDTNQEEPLLTPRELCDRLKISMTSLWRLHPPYIKVGGRKRFCWSEILRHLESRSQEVKHA